MIRESNVEFNVGDYLYHSTHGVGRVKQITGDKNPDLVIDYQKKPNYRVSARLVLAGCRRLTPDGFLALWYDDPTEAEVLLDKEPARVVAMALKDFEGARAKTEDLKAYLEAALGGRDWTKWWRKTQQALKRAEYIDTSKSDDREYRLRLESLSLAEEAFNRFQRIRYLGGRLQALEEARSVFNALRNSSELSPSHVDTLKDFYLQISVDQSLGASSRLDAIYRLGETGWLTKEDVRAAVQQLVAEGLRVYCLEDFAQNRLVDFLIQNADTSYFVPTLLTGLCASKNTMERVLDWIEKRGDSDLVIEALRAVLTENVPPHWPREDYPSLAARLNSTSILLRLMVGAPEPMPELLSSYAKLADRVGTAKLTPVEFGCITSALVRFGSMLFDRVQACCADLAPSVPDALVSDRLSSDFLLGVIGATSDPEVSRDFASGIERSALVRISSTDAILSRILTNTEGDRVQKLSLLTSWAREYAKQNPVLLNWVMMRAVDLCKGASVTDQVAMIDDLGVLSGISAASSWKRTVDSCLHQAFVNQFRRSIPPHSSCRTEGSTDVTDPLVAAAVDVICERTGSLEQMVSDLRKQLEATRVRLTEMEAHLRDAQSRMGELKQGFVQDPQRLRYEERFRILREFACSVGEFERHFAGDKRSRDMEGILRRLNSLLAAQGVLPRESIGNRITFDPTYCQFSDPTSAGAHGDEPVEVIERGYTIQDPQGHVRLLKPALVRPAKRD